VIRARETVRPARSVHQVKPLRASLNRIDDLNAESSLAALGPATTPAKDLFVRSHSALPRIDGRRWKLRIEGAVERPLAWSLADLRARDRVRVSAVLECAGNSRGRFASAAPGELRWGDCAVGSGVWGGVPLATLLEETGVASGAVELEFEGARGRDPERRGRRFIRSLPVDHVTAHPEVLLATELNGKPLTVEHGWPLRLVVPGWYGMAWVKWLTRIRLRRSPYRGYFQASRYVYRSGDGARLARDRPCEVHGKAWTGSGRLTQVEVDAGLGWTRARLTSASGAFGWSSWSLRWRPERPGPVTLRVRATDSSGATQPERPLPNYFQYGANSLHSVEVVVL
jgi:DMSO/TMAO reductase YedYZ molybdopterin-dependent catalytic subunit